MSIFDEKAYEYLTQPDNWPIAREIRDKMADIIEPRLLNEFWAEVKKGIEGKSDSKEWKVEISEDIYESDSELTVSHSAWKSLFFISYVELEAEIYLCVYRDLESKKVTDGLFRQMREKLLKTDKDNRMKGPENEVECVVWFYTGEDFRQTQTLSKILPSNRKTLVDKYTSEFLGLLEKAKPIIDEAMKQLK